MDAAERERLIRRHLPGAVLISPEVYGVATLELVQLLLTYRRMLGLPPVPPLGARPDLKDETK